MDIKISTSIDFFGAFFSADPTAMFSPLSRLSNSLSHLGGRNC